MEQHPLESNVPKLGGNPESRIQKYFCVDDDEYHAFARISKDAEVLKREPKEIIVMGKLVKGWVVELRVSATDGVVRMDPLASQGWDAFRSMGE
ncbi:MAG: hypothetical protein O7G87_02805 [bacterium]|nr:hypothetical protein [bacterium]